FECHAREQIFGPLLGRQLRVLVRQYFLASNFRFIVCGRTFCDHRGTIFVIPEKGTTTTGFSATWYYITAIDVHGVHFAVWGAETINMRLTRIRTLLFFLTLLNLLPGLGCNKRQAGAKGPIRIGFSMDSLQLERWQRDRDLFTARAKELGAEVLVQS